MQRTFALSFFLIVVLSSAISVHAQSSNTCPALVNQALSQVSTLCANLDGNNACYGNNDIVASLHDTVPPDAFDQPGDIVGVTDLESIETAPVDTSEGIWGVGLMRIQANLPNTLPGQSVLLLVTGGQQVENGVQPDEAILLPETPTMVVTNADTSTDLRPTYPAASQVDPVASIPGQTTLPADAITPDGQWIRVVYQDQPGWIPRLSVPEDADLSGLVEVAPDDLTHMQAFYLKAEVGAIECQEAPALVLVQGPQDIPVDIEVYDIRIRIQSTILLWSNPDGQRLELITLYGLATLYPDTPNEILVPPGFVTSIAYGPTPASLGTEGDDDERNPPTVGNWTPPRPLTQEELALLGFLNNLPGNLLNYQIVLPRIVRASGVGGPLPRLSFADPRAVAVVRRACDAGRIPASTCQMLIG